MDRESPYPLRPPSRAVLLLKFAVTATCFALIWKVWPRGAGSFGRVLTHPAFLVAAILLRPLFTVIMGLRTALLCAAALPPLPWYRVVRITFVGQMFNQFLPAGVGGDLARGVLLHREAKSSWPRVVSVLAIDRVVGLGSLTIFMAIFAWPIVMHQWAGIALGVAVAGGAVACGVVGLVAAGRHRGLVARLKQRVWGPDLLDAFGRVRGAPMLGAALVAAAGHGCLVVSNALFFSGAGYAVPWIDRIGVVSVSLFLGNLPITIGGHGVREGALVWLLSATVLAGRTQPLLAVDDAVAVAIAIWVIHLTVSLAGGLLAMARRGRQAE